MNGSQDYVEMCIVPPPFFLECEPWVKPSTRTENIRLVAKWKINVALCKREKVCIGAVLESSADKANKQP